MNNEFDVIIVGAGLVGAACALALNKLDLRVALVEGGVTSTKLPSEEFDSRIYAISPGNTAWLESIGVWNTIDSSRVCAIENMQIHGDDADAQLELSSFEANVNSLGFIVENNRLQHALRQCLQATNITFLAGQACVEAIWHAEKAELTLENGQIFTARLLVAADGAHSWLRTQAKIPVKTDGYGQMGVVANFETELPHAQIARQWFRQDGVLAWLPLPGNRISMVWSTSMEQAEHLQQLDAEMLADTVARAGNHALGTLRAINVTQAFPLSMQMAQALVRPGLALIGDAAHTIHPLAGQGMNLGLRDVRTLVEILAQRSSRQDVGDFMLLRRYERARKGDMMAMRFLTDGLYQLFASDQQLVRKLRNWSLRFTHRQALVKKGLIKQAVL